MSVKTMMNISAGIYDSVKNGEVGRLELMEEPGFDSSNPFLPALSALYELSKQARHTNAAHDYGVFQETIQHLEVPLSKLERGRGLRLPLSFM